MTLLLKKLLSYKERSPLITILDDRLQSSRPLQNEFIKNAGTQYILFMYLPELTLKVERPLSWLSLKKYLEPSLRVKRKISTLFAA